MATEEFGGSGIFAEAVCNASFCKNDDAKMVSYIGMTKSLIIDADYWRK